MFVNRKKRVLAFQILITPKMPSVYHCCICGNTRKYRKRCKNSRNFFRFPNTLRKDFASEKNLLEKRLAAWKNVVGSNYDKFNSLSGVISVCSDHFHSGEPANLYNSKDIDWRPSKNLDKLVAEQSRNCQDDNVQSQSTCSENASPTDTDPPSNKQSKIEPTNSNSQEKDKPPTPIIEEPVKRKVIYSRPIQPVNGIWPRLTATIITPESINIPCNYSLLLNNQQVPNKSDEIAESVSNEKTEITVKKEIDSPTVDADESVPDCDLSAAYCFTLKLKEEKATQVTAEEIRQAFLLTASTQTSWK